MPNIVAERTKRPVLQSCRVIVSVGYVQLLLSLVDIVEPNHMRMVDQLHNRNLTLDAPIHSCSICKRCL